MPEILITGATGLVGMHVAFDLTASGHTVRLLCRAGSNKAMLEKVFAFYTPEYKKQLALIEWFEGDILDIYSLEDAMEGIREVYHAAALVSFVPADKNRMLQCNIEGTANVMNAAMHCGVRKVCHVSSIAALGKRDDGGLIDEEVYWKNAPSNSWYAISKYGGEREAWRAAEEGLDVVIVNPGFIIGPGDSTRSSLALFGTVKNGMNWYTSGITGYVDVRDVSAAMIRLVKSDVSNQRFIMSSENLDYRTVINAMNNVFGKKPAGKKLSSFVGGIAWRAEKLMAALSGRAPRITRETAAAAQEQNRFSGEKIKKVLEGFSYRPVAASISDAGRFYNS